MKCYAQNDRQNEEILMDAGEVELVRMMIRNELGEFRETNADVKLALEEMRSISQTIRDAAALSAQAAVVATEAAEEIAVTSEELTEAENIEETATEAATQAATEAAIDAVENVTELEEPIEESGMVEVEEPEIEPARTHFLEKPLFGGRK